MSAPSVTVVIPSKDRDEMLEKCLRATTRQSLDPHDYEVVVVDDGPSGSTREAVERVAAEVDTAIRYVPNDTRNHGPAAARNIGWREAQAQVIAFTDDDTLPDREWLEAGTAVFGDPDVQGAMGRVVVPVPMRPTDHERDTEGLETAEFVTANAFYRKETLEEIGGFDERFKSAWREDADLYYTLIEKGAKLARVPWAIVVHPARPAGWGVSLRSQNKTQYNALLKKKHPALYEERLLASPKWYYIALLALLGLPVAALRGNRRLAAIALGTWLGLTGRFTAQRLRGASRRPGHVTEMAITSAVIPALSVYNRIKGAIKYRVRYW